jgi:hypothetical protein
METIVQLAICIGNLLQYLTNFGPYSYSLSIIRILAKKNKNAKTFIDRKQRRKTNFMEN